MKVAAIVLTAWAWASSDRPRGWCTIGIAGFEPQAESEVRQKLEAVLGRPTDSETVKLEPRLAEVVSYLRGIGMEVDGFSAVHQQNGLIGATYSFSSRS